MNYIKHLVENYQYQKAHKRLSRCTVPQVQEWAESTLWATQQGLDGFRVTHDQAALREAMLGIIGQLAAVNVLYEKTKS